MIKFILNIILFVLSLQTLQAQYTYFNQITGEIGDLSSESVYNIEVVDDGYVVWGGGVYDGISVKFLRKYNFEGEFIDENILTFENEYFYAGIVNSMQWNPYTEQFVVLQGSVIDDGVSARFLSFDTNLELEQDITYNTYSPNTYFFGFLIEPDGYVIYGEQGPLVNGEGTFIMKLDFDGNVLWNEIMQPEVNQHIYRNWSILPLDEGYLISGRGNIDGDPFGLITIVDEAGVTISELVVVDDDALQSGGIGAVRLTNGEILITQSIAFDDIEEIENPNFFYLKTRLAKFNPTSQTIYWEQDYLEELDLILGGMIDREATSDGGVIILGGRYGWFFDYYAWMMKVDADGNEEWFHEYTYESCDNCFNVLYDIELAPDGGYVAAGYFTNSEVDPRNNPWLLKIDACGDVEWQGCTPVGLEEKEPKVFSVYPNPSSGRFVIESDLNHSIASWSVYNLSGQRVAGRNTTKIQTVEFDLNLPTGLYALELVQKNGHRENHKIQIVR